MDRKQQADELLKDTEFLKLFEQVTGGAIPENPGEEWLKKIQAGLADAVAGHPELQQMKQQEGMSGKNDDGTEWLVVRPNPGFCLKLFRANGYKVFVNMCGHDKVDKPAPFLNSDGEEAWRFPLSVDKGRKDTDREGRECIVYDVLFNTQEIVKAKEDDTHKEAITNLAMQHLAQKEEKELTTDCKFLLMTKKGELGLQRIRRTQGVERADNRVLGDSDVILPTDKKLEASRSGRPTPGPHQKLIHEISDDPSPDANEHDNEEGSANQQQKGQGKPLTATPSKKASCGLQLTHTLQCSGQYDWQSKHDMSLDQVAAMLSVIGDPFDCTGCGSSIDVVVTFQQDENGGSSQTPLSKQVDVNALATNLTITHIETGELLLDLKLPYEVDPDSAQAKFTKKKRQLSVSMCVDNTTKINASKIKHTEALHRLELERSVQASLESAEVEKKRKDEQLKKLEAEKQQRDAEDKALAQQAIERYKQTEAELWETVDKEKTENQALEEFTQRKEEIAQQHEEMQKVEKVKKHAQPQVQKKEEDLSNYVGNAPQKVKQLLGVDFSNRYLFALDY